MYECNWQQNLACIAAFTEIFTFNNRPNLNDINSLTLTIAAKLGNEHSFRVERRNLKLKRLENQNSLTVLKQG